MNKKRNYSQKGGLGFGDDIKDKLLSIPGKITDIDIIRLLLSDVKECCILSDMSSYSFVLRLRMKKYTLVDTYGNHTLLDTIDMPGLGKKGKNIVDFCCKICFVGNPPLSLDEYPRVKGEIK